MFQILVSYLNYDINSHPRQAFFHKIPNFIGLYENAPRFAAFFGAASLILPLAGMKKPARQAPRRFSISDCFEAAAAPYPS